MSNFPRSTFGRFTREFSIKRNAEKREAQILRRNQIIATVTLVISSGAIAFCFTTLLQMGAFR